MDRLILTDQQGNPYTGTFNGQTVTFTDTNGTESTGSWIQGSNPTSGITGGGSLDSRFQFTFENHGPSQTLNAEFTFSGTPREAEAELQQAGYVHFNLGQDVGYSEWRLPTSARNSSHFNVYDPNALQRLILPSPKWSGNVHVGEYYPWPIRQALKHWWEDVF